MSWSHFHLLRSKVQICDNFDCEPAWSDKDTKLGKFWIAIRHDWLWRILSPYSVTRCHLGVLTVCFFRDFLATDANGFPEILSNWQKFLELWVQYLSLSWYKFHFLDTDQSSTLSLPFLHFSWWEEREREWLFGLYHLDVKCIRKMEGTVPSSWFQFFLCSSMYSRLSATRFLCQ